jgi:potassium-transporting ATPase KdpC subunit
MTQMIRTSLMLILMMTLILGLAYPLIVTAIGQMVFHDKANGSMIEADGKVVGSQLLGQSFESPHYFWGRLSATTPAYNASASTGSNLNPANPKLLENANARIALLRKMDPTNKAIIPIELITASASGMDPHVSVAAIMYQLRRVAKSRNMKEADLKALVEKHTENPVFGILGEPYVNVLRLNMSLDKK